MPVVDRHAPAELVWSHHQPWKASVGECLRRWAMLAPQSRTHSFLVVHGEAGARRTLNGVAIAELAAASADCDRQAA